MGENCGRVIELNLFCNLEYLLFAEAEVHFTTVLQAPREFTLKMFTDSFSQPQEVRRPPPCVFACKLRSLIHQHVYSKPGPNQRAGEDANAKLSSA